MLGWRKNNAEEPAAPPEKAAGGAPAPAPASGRRSAPPPAPPQAHKRLGELLLESGAITQGQLDEAIKKQQAEGGFIGQILLQLGYVTQETIASYLVKQCKIPHLSLLDYDIGPDVAGLVPEEVCHKYHLLPIDKLGRILTVAMVDPLDLEALEAVRAACPELRIKPILCNYEHFMMVASKLFRKPGDAAPVTAQSFGLPEHLLGPAPKEPAPAPDPQEQALDSAVNQMISDVAEAAAPAVAHPAGGAEGPGLAPEALAAVLRDSMRDAMREAVSALASRPAPPETAGMGPEEFASALKDALRETLGAMQPAAPAAADAPPAPAPAGPSPAEFAEAMRESLAVAMEEAMAAAVVQLRAMQGKNEGEGASPGMSPEALAAALRESVAEAVRGVQQAQAEQLREMTEATLASVKQVAELVEANVVATGNAQDLGRKGAARHHSVTPFGKPPAKESAAEEDARVREAMDSEKPIEGFTFDLFFPGKVNAFTFKASQAVAAAPGEEYNPFFLFGDVGLGKTHLISAIGNAILQHKSQPRVGYVSASHFSRRLAAAMRENALDAFRENYCHWDVLILDDIQFLGGRVEAQEEFFHIFNVLRHEGRQIIIASDKAPDRLGLLEQRLVSRFASGIVTQLKPPEWETRMEILRHHAKAAGSGAPEEVLSLIAMRAPNDIRKMVGALRKITAYASLVEQSLTCELADEILSHLGAEQAA